MPRILEKQRLLTGFLEMLLLQFFNTSSPPIGKIITPSDPKERGSQLSLVFTSPVDGIFEDLTRRGIVVRTKNLLRGPARSRKKFFSFLVRFL